MLEVEIPLPPNAKPTAIIKAVEQASMGEGLAAAHKGTLATYPGCTHWHYKKGKERGTLEITWWPQEKRLWLKVAANREAPWIKAAVTHLQQTIPLKL
jgi:hypothetical protein